MADVPFPNRPIKKIRTSVYPVHAVKTSGLFARTEPPLTPAKVRSRYLKGVHMTLPNGDKITDSDLKDYIEMMYPEAEMELGGTIEPVEFTDRLPFDLNLYKNFVHTKTLNGPIQSVTEFAIYSSDGLNLFNIPPEWIDPGQFSTRQVNVIPYLSSSSVMLSNSAGGAGSFFLASMGGYRWIPSYWSITYTAGYASADGQIPKIINDLIGTMVALFVLGMLGPAHFINSQSLSQDGISQSSSGPGVARYKQRLDELNDQKSNLIKKIKGMYSKKIVVGSL